MVWVDGVVYMYVIGKMQFYQKFGLFRSLIALNMHIYLEYWKNTCNLWVGGGHKNAKIQNAGWD